MKLWYSLFLLTTVLPLYTEEAQTPSVAETFSFQKIDDFSTTLPILTPALEGREVEKLILANGLKVLLISDPGAEQSAAAVAVQAGSWEDPQEYPGMAHFCEHMLFMGTKTYPDEFQYMHFITDRGGSVNAFTASDKTVYMFSIPNNAFEEALNRLSHFFIDPLFSQHCIDRELHAVDQEHAKNIEHDGWRQYMILKETSNPDHPHATFSTGNAQTLAAIPQSAVKQWYEAHYSADRMYVVLLSPLSLDELRSLAVQDFSSVPKVPTQNVGIIETMTSAQQRGHMLFIQPVKEIKQLSLYWEVPRAFANEMDKKAPDLVAYALNQEGENSLIQTLKREKLAESVQVECDRFSQDNLFFSINIALTDRGIHQLDTAILRIFQALARLKKEGFPAHLFQQMQTMATLKYQYQSREDAFFSVMETASTLPYEEFTTYPLKTKIPTTFDPAFITSFLESLDPNTCIYTILADPLKTGITPDTKEKWMNAQYAVRELAPSRLAAWKAASPIPAIQSPTPNPYLPTNLSLAPVDEKAPTYNHPFLLRADDKSKVYFAQDTRYHVPEAAFIFNIKSPLLDNSTRATVFSDLYSRALTEKLSSTLSLAASAGINVSIHPENDALQITITGYNDKAPTLAQTLFSSLNQVFPSKEEFEIYRLSIAAQYDNAAKELPIKQAMGELDSVLFSTPTCKEKLNAIQSLSFEEFQMFSKNIFKSAFVEALLYGNLQITEAKTLIDQLQARFQHAPFPRLDHYKKHILLLSEKYGPYKLAQTTNRQGSGVLLLLQEGQFTFEMRAIQQILGTALTEAFFDTLRTQQQTAYIAKAWNTEEARQLLQFFAVQSSTHAPTDLLARFELFLESFDKNLSIQIPEGRFESIRSSLITLLKMPPENMPSMAAQLYELAFEYDNFHWVQDRIDALQELTYERFSLVCHTLLSRNNPRRLAVLVEGTLLPENDFHYELITKEDVQNVGTFVSVK